MRTLHRLHRGLFLTAVAGGLCFWLVTSRPTAQAQPDSVAVAGREYRNVDGKWYSYSNGHRGDEIIPSRLIVRLKDRGKVSPAGLQSLGLTAGIVTGPLFSGFYTINVGQGREAVLAAQKLVQSGRFDVVEFDGYGTRLATPQDEYFPEQWNLDDTKLRMERTWDITTGLDSVIVAIVDSGTDYGHQDLDNNIWTNPNETPGNGQDDDNNGYVDDIYGWDFIGDDGYPSDSNGHGTGMAGFVLAETNNYWGGGYEGIAGIAGGWGNTKGCLLMTLKDGNASPYAAYTALGIRYAAENGADVIVAADQWWDEYSVVTEAINLNASKITPLF